MDISNMLRYLRNKKGITQKELAETTKLSLHSIISYENGKRNPNGKALAKFEDFFQVSGKYLMGEIEVEAYGEDVEGWDHEATQMNAFQEMEQDWYCTAKHFHSFLEDAKYGRVADFGRPCNDCKYLMGGMDCNTSLAYWRFQRLSNATGIIFEMGKKKKSHQ